MKRRRLIPLALVLALMAQAACQPSDLHRLNVELNRAAKTLNAAAKTSHQFYETGIYGPVGSEGAIRIRQKAATAIGESNEYLIKALTMAKALTPATFEAGKLEVLKTLSLAAAQLHIGNDAVDLILQGVATAINAAVIILQNFKSSDLKYLPMIQKWQIERIEA